MSDVGSTLTLPELPFRDPPRMAGSYGVPMNDVFGMSSGSIPEMNRRASGQGAGDTSRSSGGQGNTSGDSGNRKEMKMDEKWIPSMPTASWKNWTSRGKELSGFKSWLEQFSG